jgi:hypothetical protein
MSVSLHKPAELRAALTVALAAATALAGCGMAGAQPTLAADDGYQAIQRDEAVIERERSVTLGAEADACEGACGAVVAICEAKDRICTVAADLQEADALTRCARARESCTDSRAHVARTCACEPDAGD